MCLLGVAQSRLGEGHFIRRRVISPQEKDLWPGTRVVHPVELKELGERRGVGW